MTMPTGRSTSATGRMTLPPPPPPADAVVLKRVTDSAYQVCDSRYPPLESRHLLGFVEVVGEEVELMQVGAKFVWTTFACMDDAISHVINTAAATRAAHDAGDHSWIGRGEAQ